MIGVDGRPTFPRAIALAACAVVWWGCLLFAFGETLSVLVEAEAQGQSEDLGRGPVGLWNEKGQNYPVVPPTDKFHGTAGDERIVVHASTIEGQATLAAQGVVAGEHQDPRGSEGSYEHTGQVHAQGVEAPAGMAEEAMVTRPMAVADVTAGKDTIGDVAAPAGKSPATEQMNKVAIRRSSKDGTEFV